MVPVLRLKAMVLPTDRAQTTNLDADWSQMPDIHRSAIYARVSTKDKGQDPENQLSQLREFAQAQGWRITHEYVDHGRTSDHTQFKRLFTTRRGGSSTSSCSGAWTGSAEKARSRP